MPDGVMRRYCAASRAVTSAEGGYATGGPSGTVPAAEDLALGANEAPGTELMRLLTSSST